MSFISPDRGAVCNVLLTCCKDSVCRLWAETLLPGDSHLSGYHSNLTASQHSDTVKCAASSKKKSCNGKIHINPGQEVSSSKNVLLLMIQPLQYTLILNFMSSSHLRLACVEKQE